ncbi:NADPH-dependent FMN reductase [Pontibacter kalidii]|uniref:NADPH-dependent FMN reductase n=1 Tax=Pontibacter kalidii TaxID=2592049 RepID=UPI002258598A|nr:NAD(P)H-dependent oxidoreductase [Pontibacter kalidii]
MRKQITDTQQGQRSSAGGFWQTDAFIVTSPEYNGSISGFLKNAIDWVSRFRPQPFSERHALLLSASPSMGAETKACGPFECL